MQMSDNSDSDFENEAGGGAAPPQAIPRWQRDPPPGLRQYLERQRHGIPGAFERAQNADAAPAIPPVVNAMEQALEVMERVLEDQTSWTSDILPRGHIIEGGFQTRHAVIARLKLFCHQHGFKVGSYFGGRDTSFGSKTLRLQCTCGRPKKKSDERQRHFNSRHSCLGCKWFRYIVPFERGNDTPAVIDATTGASKPVYAQCKWMISNHASSLHCDDHTGHCKVPHNHLAGIHTETVQQIIEDHGMLDSISALQDRILKKTGQFFSWRRLRHMVRKETDELGVRTSRTQCPGKSQELMDWLASQKAAGALEFTALTMDLEELDAVPAGDQPRDGPAQPAQPQGIIAGLLSRIRHMWRTPLPSTHAAEAPISGQWLLRFFLQVDFACYVFFGKYIFQDTHTPFFHITKIRVSRSG